ncbi:hypothetical protein P170DRAFT_514552 [Aspergillus steynii IBT 23096]|uniref:LIM zinc-binding domain-containing protein n=1 Tax=Aspergillus steynii IBT 23096 TaxID=1392250 RepID=A0A2I2FRQ7_9EURO|nr:uncharacterized protein P170DRAFT_514552 [Aspergillus steynii IBT 23096]PLB43297.1 hypothetical protein P170DRAFT_514552 [Aspergillus steynii IBT 23096]
MAATMGLGLLPMIKCSNCGVDVEISSMGDHVCAKSEPAPPPPSKSDYDSLSRNTGRTGPPAPINPSVANRPFLRPDNAIGINEPAGLSPQPSPLRMVQQSQTAVPIQPQTSEIVTISSDDLPRFPLPQSMSDKESGAMTPLPQEKMPPIPSHPYTSSNNRPPATAPLPRDLDGDAPPPLPKDEPSSLPRIAHKYGSSIDSKSSYRTSFASSRYGDNSSKRSTAMSGRRPSFGSVNQPYKYPDDDAPPVPSLRQTTYSVSDYNMSRESRNDRQEDHGSYNLGAWHQVNAQSDHQQSNSGPLRVSSHTDSDRLSSTRGSTELFFRSPSQTSFERLPDPHEFPERSTSINPPTKVEYKPFKSPTTATYLHPSPDVDGHGYEDMQRKPSDATSEGALSVSNFARSLGLDLPEQAPENYTVSSDSSPSDLRSGTSFSSVASEADARRKHSEQSRLGPVIEERRIDTRQQYGLHAGDQTESPIDLEPPQLRDPLFSPDSPTDPAILYGSVSLLPDKTQKALPELPSKLRSATGPMSHTQNKQSQDKNLPDLPRSATAPLSHVPKKASQDKNLPTVPALAPPMPTFEDEPSRGTRFFPDLEASLPSPSHIPKKPSWSDRLSPERLRTKPSISHVSKKQSREENIVPDFRRPSPEPGHVPQRPSRENVPDLRQPSPEPSYAKELVQERPYPNIPGFSVEQPFHISSKPSRDETSTPPSASHILNKSSKDEKYLPDMPRSSPEPSHVQNKPSREEKLAPVVPGFLPEAPFHIPRKPSWMDRFTPEVSRSPTPPISHTAKSSQDERSLSPRPQSPTEPYAHIQNKPSLDDKYLPDLPKSPAEPTHVPNKLSQDKYLPELPQPTPEPSPSHVPHKPSQSERLSPELTKSPPTPSSKKPSQDNKYLPDIPPPTPEPFSHIPSKPSQSDRLSPELARSPPPAHSAKLSQDDKSLPKLPEPSPLFKPDWEGRRSPEPPKSKTPEPSYIPQKPVRDPRLSPEPPRSAPPPSHLRGQSRNERSFPEPRSAEPRFAHQGSHLHNQPSRDEKNSPELLNASIDPAARLSPRPKGPCRGCGEVILGKSVSSADGRLTGRYHKDCFVCYQCRIPFRTADFYVLRDLPFCAQHYHERNGSLCQGCLTGIEGQFLETNERQGRGPGDRRRYHPQCLTCRTCNVLLNGEYFEWNGQVYCERDARRAAASTPPPRMRRPTMTSSPLAGHSRGPSRGHPPPPGYPGRGRGGPRPPMPPMPGMPGPAYLDGPYGPPPAARRFPERRTTKLMML